MSSNTTRLLAILEAGRKVKSSTEYIEGWRTIFRAPDLYEAYKKIGLLHALVKDASVEAQQYFPDDIGSVTHWDSLLTQLLRKTNPGAEWHTFFNRIDNHTFSYLRLQSRFIDSQLTDRPVDEKQLENVRQILLEALEETLNSNAPPDVVVTIARRIRLIIGAIEDFMITGKEAIFDEIKAAAVEVAYYRQQDAQTPISEKLTTALGTLANAITVTTGIPQLAAPAAYLLNLIK